MHPMNASLEKGGGNPTAFRIALWAVGWVVALAGALSTFSVPLYLTVLVLLFGALTSALAYPRTPPMNWRSNVVLGLGGVLIIGVLELFGEERVRHWVPHPAGYIVAWFGCFYGFRQLRQLLRDHKTAQV